nr:3-isopropylmalate dehydratase small subunit 1-like [Coffea arabica]
MTRHYDKDEEMRKKTRFIEPGQFKSNYSIVIGGDNFGYGSSREQCPGGADRRSSSGGRILCEDSFQEICGESRNLSIGDFLQEFCEECRTGDVVTIELADILINHYTGRENKLKPIRDAGRVIEAGGIFAYA